MSETKYRVFKMTVDLEEGEEVNLNDNWIPLSVGQNRTDPLEVGLWFLAPQE
jgi:hypothetical protein